MSSTQRICSQCSLFHDNRHLATDDLFTQDQKTLECVNTMAERFEESPESRMKYAILLLLQVAKRFLEFILETERNKNLIYKRIEMLEGESHSPNDGSNTPSSDHGSRGSTW